MTEHPCSLEKQFDSEMTHAKEFRKEVKGDVDNLYSHVGKIKDRLARLETKVAVYSAGAAFIFSALIQAVEHFVK